MTKRTAAKNLKRKGGDRRFNGPAKAKRRAPKPRSMPLPGMEDHAIEPLERVAIRYAEIRDERQELTREEVKLKSHAKTLMHKYDKTVYKHGGVEIRMIAGEESIKVKIRKPDDDEAAEHTGDSGMVVTEEPEQAPF